MHFLQLKLQKKIVHYMCLKNLICVSLFIFLIPGIGSLERDG